MESSEHNWANISETICPKLLIFGEQASWTLFFQNSLTNPIISQISFFMTSHFGTLLDVRLKHQILHCFKRRHCEKLCCERTSQLYYFYMFVYIQCRRRRPTDRLHLKFPNISYQTSLLLRAYFQLFWHNPHPDTHRLWVQKVSKRENLPLVKCFAEDIRFAFATRPSN